MIKYEDMTPDERDRLIYMLLSEDALRSITMIMHKKYGENVDSETIRKFAFKVARNRMYPEHLKHIIYKKYSDK